MKLAVLEALNRARAARRACVVVSALATAEATLVMAEAIAHEPDEERKTLLQGVLRSGKARRAALNGQELFLKPYVPPVKFILIGAVHIAQNFIPMGRLIGLDMCVIDPREAFASFERFPDVPLYAEWPQDVPLLQALDAYHAMALLTHDPKIDDPALEIALNADCFYIGALGSKRTHESRLARFAAKGYDKQTLARIHAPIGLDIGAVSPAEIAASILAELIAVLRTGARHPRVMMDDSHGA